MTGPITEIEREEVANEARHWVRISRACNNHCTFCLDSDVQDGTMVPREEVEKEIREGLEAGATRLILSGGEASIHPDFVDLIRLGKSLGYAHVQTISNGRMFAYRDFTTRAIDAGLDEVTFSLHGHTPELSDELTGVEGSFVQTIAGIRNVVVTHRCIVSGDVVVNRLNYPHLRSVLDLFISLGVREFDILMLVPFGRATPDEGRDLLVDPSADISHLHRALELSRDPTLHFWTNRMDPRLLEGYEYLIQDPHKLHDEVRGRSQILGDLVRGRRMRCAGVRCRHCFISDLCSTMKKAVRSVAKGAPGTVMVDVRSGPPAPPVASVLERPRKGLWIRAHDIGQVLSTPALDNQRSLWLQLDDLTGLEEAVASGRLARPSRLIVDRAALVEPALAFEPRTLVVAVNTDTGSILSGLNTPTGVSLRLWHDPAPDLRSSVQRDVDDFRAALSNISPARFVNIPPCLCTSTQVQWLAPLDLGVVDDDGLVDPDRWVDHFVRHHYRVKSTRCQSCAHDSDCRGIPISLVRNKGLGILNPV